MVNGLLSRIQRKDFSPATKWLWTDILDEVMPLENSARAVLFCQQHRLRNVRIRLTFENRKYDVVLPLAEFNDNATGGKSVSMTVPAQPLALTSPQ